MASYKWVNLDDLRDEGFFDDVERIGVESLRLELHPGDDKPIVLVDRNTGERVGAYDRVEDCPINCPEE